MDGRGKSLDREGRIRFNDDVVILTLWRNQDSGEQLLEDF